MVIFIEFTTEINYHFLLFFLLVVIINLKVFLQSLVAFLMDLYILGQTIEDQKEIVLSTSN